MKHTTALLSLLILSSVSMAQSFVQMNWEPRSKLDHWFLQQQWESRVGRTTMTFQDGQAETGQVLFVAGDSLLWQPSYGPTNLGEAARWVGSEDIRRAESRLRVGALTAGSRTWLTTVYTVHALNLILNDNLPQAQRQADEAAILGVSIGLLTGSVAAGFQALTRLMPTRWDVEEEGFEADQMLKKLNRRRVYRTGSGLRAPFWELWPHRRRIRLQVETGHIDYPAARNVAALNIPSGLVRGPEYPNTRFHSLSLGYALDDFTQVGARFSPARTSSFISSLNYPYNGDAGYSLTYSPQWGLWASRDLLPLDRPHMLRTFCQIGAGVFAQQIGLNNFVNVESYARESGDFQTLGQSGTQQGQLRVRGLELFLRLGYRIHPNVSLITTIRHQWARQSGQLDPIVLNLPVDPDAEYSLAYYDLLIQDQDLRAAIIQTGLEIRL